MKPLLTVFIDGLKPESVKHMPFLNSLEEKRRLRGELGYSPTCYASMFSGVYPNKHHHWFTWQYSPDTSPYKWLRKYKIDRLPHNLFSRYFCFRATEFLTGGTIPWQGVMRLSWWSIPVKYWHYFDKPFSKHWGEPGFIDGYPTVFDTLRVNGIPYEIVGLEVADLAESSSAVEQYGFNDVKPWTLFFIGDIDPLTHWHGQDSSLVIERLRRIDGILQKKYELLESKAGDFYFVLFSDHGHAKVEDTVDLSAFFDSQDESINDYIYFIDGTMARFWFRNKGEEQRVRRVLSQLEDKGFILTEEYLRKYHINMPDNRYGDLVFYLDVPCMFTHGVKVFWRRSRGHYKSTHGYLPDHPDSEAVLVANRKLRDSTYMELVDIMPSVLDVFGIEIPGHVDGKSIWK